MSYKHALALTAFGLGAVLQGCSEDDEKEACTVDCEDKCKDITVYTTLAKGTTVDDACVKCIGGRPDVSALKDDTATTHILQWTKALANAIKTDATAEQKAIPIDALQYCGAKQVDVACANTPAVNYVTETDDIDAKVLLLGAECGICHLLVEATDCATAKTGLTACGNVPAFNCDQDYSCHDVTTFNNIKDAAAADVAGCKTCLDEEAAAADPSLTDYDTANTGDALVQTSARFEAISELWETCGAQPNIGSCAGVTLSATDVTYELIMAAINAHGSTSEDVAFNCGVCVASQTSDTSTCSELNIAAEACGFTADTLKCDACAADNSYDADCVACATAVAGSSITAAALSTNAAADAAWSSAIVSAMAQCGASVFTDIVHTGACGATPIDFSGLTTIATVGAVVDNQAASCNLCIAYHVALVAEERTCASWDAGADVCTTGTVTTHGTCTE